MMASNLLSRMLPPGDGSPSIYETIQQHDDDSETSDFNDRAGIALDEQNLGERSENLDFEHAGMSASQTTTRSSQGRGRLHGTRDRMGRVNKGFSRPRWMPKSQQLRDVEEQDDDVPASLLFEGGDDQQVQDLPNLPPPPSFSPNPTSARGNAARNGIQSPQDPHTVSRRAHPARTTPFLTSGFSPLAMADPKEKAMWRWTNVENLDNYLQEVYMYFLDHGFWSIILRRALNLLTLSFIIGFSYFLGACIDYSSLRGSTQMSEILIPRCASKMGTVANVLLWCITFLWITKVFQYIIEIKRLWNMHEFYHHLLDISDGEIQTISWQEIVSRLMALRDANPNIATKKSSKNRQFAITQNKERLDAHDIANRLMRQENYMIAMINKDILDLTLPIPFFRNRQLFSRALEWNIQQCVMDYVFNSRGQVRQLFLKDTHRKALSEGLRRRFIFAGTANLLIAPFLITYFLVQYFFENFTEFQKNPAEIGSRQYNPLAEWKFREFNELWHLFQKRINMSYPFAARYVNQFPKAKTVQAARFVAFVSGALASVLALASVIDPELFLGFEVTKDRTVLFYLSVFGTIWAVARGMLPDDNHVYDPEIALTEVIEFTHYKPSHWEGRLHSNEVRSEFAQLYQMKIVITLEEVLSMIFTPFVLWYSLPKCSDRIIDFFREFTVHVDGIGYVCSFAEFNFQKNPNLGPKRQTSDVANNAQGLTDEYYAAKDQKLEASYWGFMNDYARNPKTDVRFPYTRRRPGGSIINPPPPFPGLLSPTTVPVDTNVALPTARSIYNSPRRALGLYSSAVPSTFPTQHSDNEPLTSMLLDPHHQPNASGFSSPQALRPRKHRSHIPKTSLDRAVEVDEDLELAKESEAAAEDVGGELGSWKINDQNDDDSDDEEDVDALTAGEKGAGGVLGLIRQFQLTHGETRAGGGGVGT
jgi:autophagy-related protein 9